LQHNRHEADMPSASVDAFEGKADMA